MLTTLSNQGTELGLRPALIYYLKAHAGYLAWAFLFMHGFYVATSGMLFPVLL